MNLRETLRVIDELKQRLRILERIQDEDQEEIIIREMTGFDYALLIGSIILLVFLVSYVLVSFSCVPLSIRLS